MDKFSMLQFAKILGISKSTVRIYANELESNGYKIERTVENHRIFSELDKNLFEKIKEVKSSRTVERKDLIVESLKKFNLQVNEVEKVEKSEVKEVETIPYNEVIDYLNQKTNREYRPSTNTHKRFIKARWNEGFRLGDFKKVIDFKTADWINTDYAKYLRPETLFGNKFESYLNQNKEGKRKPDVESILNKARHYYLIEKKQREILERKVVELEEKLAEVEKEKERIKEQVLEDVIFSVNQSLEKQKNEMFSPLKNIFKMDRNGNLERIKKD